MTKKDYVQVARMLRDIRRRVGVDPRLGAETLVTLDEVEDGCVDIFKADNNRFDEDRFRAACARNGR